MFKNLEIEDKGPVATLWMNRPEAHNAFDELMITELTSAFQQLDQDNNVRIIVLAGRGRSFSAGADLGWMQRAAAYSKAENLEDARALAKMLNTLSTLTKPTIARVHGAAIGGGMGLVCACDIAVCAESASFATSEVKFGIMPSAISPYVIAAIGPRQAHRYFLTAERISATRAAEIGLSHEVCALELLDAKISDITGALLQGGPNAQAASKNLIRSVASRTISTELVEATAEWIATLRATPEAREGIAAFLQKRPAAWIKQ